MKNRKTLFFLILSFLVFSIYGNLSASSAKTFNKPFAVFLSVVSPGMGQIYSGQLDKGLAIWTASAALSAGFLLTVADIDLNSTGGPFPFNIGLRFKKNLTHQETFWAVGLGVTFLSVYVYNLLDMTLYNEKDNKLALRFQPDSVKAIYSLKF